MEPKSILAVASFAQSLAGIGSDAPDPSRVAIFETYQAVQVLNERVDYLGEVLIEIRKDQIDLPSLLDRQNRASEARVAERRLISYMDAIFSSHLLMLDNIAAGQDYEVASSRFGAEILRHNINFDTDLGVLVRASTYELPTALAAIEMAQVIDAADGSAPQAVRNRALATLEDVGARLVAALEPELEYYGRKVDVIKAELDSVVGGSWWTDGGRRVDRTLSYYDNIGTFIYCWQIDPIKIGDLSRLSYYQIQVDQPIWYVIMSPAALAEDDLIFCGERFSKGGFRGGVHPADFVYVPRGPYAFRARDNSSYAWNYEGYRRRDEARAIVDRLNAAILGYDIILSYQQAVAEGIERLRAKVLDWDMEATRDYLTELTELAMIGAPGPSETPGELTRQQRLAADLAKAAVERNWAQASLAASQRIDSGVERLRAALVDYEAAANGSLADVVKVLTLTQKFLDAAAAVDEIAAAVSASATKGGAADRGAVAAPKGPERVEKGQDVPAADRNVAGDGPAVEVSADTPGTPPAINPRDIDRAFISANPNFRSGDPVTDLRIVLMRLESASLPTTDPMTTGVTEVEKLIAEALALNLEPGTRLAAPQIGPVATFASYAAANRLGELAVGSARAWLPARVALELTKVSTIDPSSEWTRRDEAARGREIVDDHFQRVLNWRVPLEKRNQIVRPLLESGPSMRASPSRGTLQ